MILVHEHVDHSLLPNNKCVLRLNNIFITFSINIFTLYLKK